MGGGTWTTSSLNNYTIRTRGMSYDTFSTSANLSAQSVYKSMKLSEVLNPKNIVRQCCDSDEHPETLPVILALDVTGSMGAAAVKVAQKLNEIMTSLYADETIKDIEFCVMGIGDLYSDSAPIQMSQFESDVRIAEQLDAIYFEGGGGGNTYESYTAAWYMGVYHCDLDCWKRGQKGIIITLGDELPNPYLPKDSLYYNGLAEVTGDKIQGDIETKDLLEKAREKFDIYHLSVNDSDSCYKWNNDALHLDKAWEELLGKDNYSVVTLNNLARKIVNIISKRQNQTNSMINANGEVTW